MKKILLITMFIFSFNLNAMENATTESGKEIIVFNNGSWSEEKRDPPLPTLILNENMGKIIKIYNIKIEKKNKVTLSFKIKNISEKIISGVSMIIYYQDKFGNDIFESEHLPIYYNKRFPRIGSKLLKPNYIEEESYYLEAPSEWEKRKIRIEIKDIEFD